MNRFIISAAAAAELILAAGASLAPAQAAPLPSGVRKASSTIRARSNRPAEGAAAGVPTAGADTAGAGATATLGVTGATATVGVTATAAGVIMATGISTTAATDMGTATDMAVIIADMGYRPIVT